MNFNIEYSVEITAKKVAGNCDWYNWKHDLVASDKHPTFFGQSDRNEQTHLTISDRLFESIKTGDSL